MFWVVLLVIVLIVCTTMSAKYWIYNRKSNKFTLRECQDHKYNFQRTSKETIDECINSSKRSKCTMVRVNVRTDPLGQWAVFGFLAGTWLFGAAITTGILINEANNVENSFYTIEELSFQRDALLNEFDEVLDNEDFVQLMNAAVPEDVKFLKNNPEVTGFLLGRADRIVAVNTTLFEARNTILNKAKGVCSSVNNPFVPIIPLMLPECKLGDILALTRVEE